MLYLVNPARKRRKKGTTMAKAKRRPSAKQLAARRKFAAMARARSRAAKTSKRARARTTVAKRKRSMRRRRAPMRSVQRKRGAPVSRAAWKASPYRRNPKRRRRTYRRNPPFGRSGIPGQIMDLGTGAVVALAGGAVSRMASTLIPFGGVSPLANFAKGTLVAIGIRVFGEKLIGRENARIAAIGALMAPTRDLVVSFVPDASRFLGAYATGVMAMPTFPGTRGIGTYAAYAANGLSEQDSNDDEQGMAAYPQEVWQG